MADQFAYFMDPDLWIQMGFMPFLTLIYACVVSLLMIGRKRTYRRWSTFFLISFAGALLGAVAGQITGQSRIPAVTVVLPAILALMGGLMVYLVGTGGLRIQTFVALTIISLSLGLGAGTHWGSTLRTKVESLEFVKKSDARSRGALQELKNEVEFAEIKKEMEKLYGQKFDTPFTAYSAGNEPIK